MDSQVEAVRCKILKLEDETVEIKQELATAKQEKNGEKEGKLFDMLLSLNNRLSGLQEKENILLRSQAPSEPCLWLVHAGSHHVALHSVETRMCVYEMCISD